MKVTHRAFWPLTALALAASTLVAPALAAPTVYFSPVNQNTLGPTVSVDILVKDIVVGQSIGAVGMTLNWNSFVLSGNSFSVDPDSKMGVGLDPLNNNSGPLMASSLLFFFVADISFVDDAALGASEGSGFKLASVTFNTVGNGLSTLTFSNANLFGFDGSTNLNARFDTGSICVGDPAGCVNRIPEPTTPLLVMAALGGLAFTRRAQRKAA